MSCIQSFTGGISLGKQLQIPVGTLKRIEVENCQLTNPPPTHYKNKLVVLTTEWLP